MQTDDLGALMRPFEQSNLGTVLPGLFMIVRLDGRSFSRGTHEVWRFQKPFDPKFRDLMIASTQHLFQTGFRVVFAYTQSDEISVLLHQDENTYGRSITKTLSVLAGEASAAFSIALGQAASFDARISQLPSQTLIVDYFRWRASDGLRNALNSYCYWTLRNLGIAARAADSQLLGLSVAQKNELLFQHGINFNDVPAWQKRGIGLYRTEVPVQGLNPLTGANVAALRRQIAVDLDLPVGDAWSQFLWQQAGAATHPPAD